MAPSIDNPVKTPSENPFTKEGVDFSKIPVNSEQADINKQTLAKLWDPKGLFCQICQEMVSSTHNHPIA